MPMIKDPTFNVYAKGGNVENRKNTPKKDELLKLAKDVKDIEFDLENEIVDILKQEYPMRDVCKQIARSMDHPSRLELLHILFGLSLSDGNIHPSEEKLIHTISNYLNINQKDFLSIKAMFIKEVESDYKILEISKNSTDEEVKKAYRKMAIKYHPDKVGHLGEEVRNLAEEKFKMVNKAYNNIKNSRSTYG